MPEGDIIQITFLKRLFPQPHSEQIEGAKEKAIIGIWEKRGNHNEVFGYKEVKQWCEPLSVTDLTE